MTLSPVRHLLSTTFHTIAIRFLDKDNHLPVGCIVCFCGKMPSTEYIRGALYTRLKTAFNIERDSALIVIARIEVRNASDKTYLILFSERQQLPVKLWL